MVPIGALLTIATLSGWRVLKAGPLEVVAERAEAATRAAERVTEILIDITLKLHNRLGTFGPDSRLTEAFEWRDDLIRSLEGDYWTPERIDGLIRHRLTKRGLLTVGRQLDETLRAAWKAGPDHDVSVFVPYNIEGWLDVVRPPDDWRRMASNLGIEEQCASAIEQYERIYREQSPHHGPEI